MPVRADRTTYVADTHFDAHEADETVPLYGNPTPAMEANKEALLVTVLRDLCESDIEVLETLVADGGKNTQRN